MSAVRQFNVGKDLGSYTDGSINADFTSRSIDTSYLKAKTFRIITTGFTGTIDLQVSWDNGQNWVNAYAALRGGSGAPSTAQLSYTTDTSGYTYHIAEHAPLMQVVVARSAGSVAIHFFGSEQEPTIEAEAQVGGTFTDKSGTITSGGSAQQIAAANTARRYFLLQNVSDTDMWVNFGVVAVANQPSFKIIPNASIVFEGRFVPTGLVSVIGATTGKSFTAKEA